MFDAETFRLNRDKFTLEQLKPYIGKWVAFSLDGTRIVASGDDLEELENQLAAANIDPETVGFECIDTGDDSFVGGVQFNE